MEWREPTMTRRVNEAVAWERVEAEGEAARARGAA